MMNFFRFLWRKKRTTTAPAPKSAAETTAASKEDAAVANSVLAFIALGLTNGAESLPKNYKPRSKVAEFADVSMKILEALKRAYEHRFWTNSVVITMKVNHKSKNVELTQLGYDVMLTLDDSVNIISSITLTELYANLRNDMIKHPEIYGKERQATAKSFPDPAR